MWRADLLEKTQILGKIEGRRRGQQRMRWLDGIITQWTWVWVNSRSWWWIGRPGVLQSTGSQRVGHDWTIELNWMIHLFTAILPPLPKEMHEHVLNFKYQRVFLITSESEMATHSSVLAWRIPGTGERGGLLSMGSHRVGHDWSDLAAAAGNYENYYSTQGTLLNALWWPK